MPERLSLMGATVVDVRVDGNNDIIGLMLCIEGNTYTTVDTVKNSWHWGKE